MQEKQEWVEEIADVVIEEWHDGYAQLVGSPNDVGIATVLEGVMENRRDDGEFDQSEWDELYERIAQVIRDKGYDL